MLTDYLKSIQYSRACPSLKFLLLPARSFQPVNSDLTLKDFSFDFPPHLIAAAPLPDRSASRVLVYDRQSAQAQISQVKNLSDFLRAGDVVVVNETRVLPARFKAQKETGAQLEGLFLEGDDAVCKVWLKGRVQPGDRILLLHGPHVRILEKSEKEVTLEIPQNTFLQYLETSGFVPIPPYIRAERLRQKSLEDSSEDPDRYQTVFARDIDLGSGFSVAAPTASLHMDQALLDRLRQKGIQIEKITLHVNRGTFEPLSEKQIAESKLHTERVQIPSETWIRIQKAKQENRRILAVGTTVMRSLESAALREPFIPEFGTDLFIRPGFEFKVCDALLTNFHWPESSLLILVASFMEPQAKVLSHRWRPLYKNAIDREFRLFSYGDAMLIL